MTTQIKIDLTEIDLDVFIRAIKTETSKLWYIKPDKSDGKYVLYFNASLTADEVTAVNLACTNYVVPPPVSALDSIKEDLKEAVDYAAGQTRSRYATIKPGQSAVYLRKAADASAYIEASYPADDAPYPYVKAEKNARNMKSGANATSQEVADDLSGVGGIQDQWDVLASAIEEVRIGFKGLIDDASDEDEAKGYSYNAVVILNNI